MVSKIEHALEDCLTRLDAGESLDACLALYPDLASELKPMLSAAASVGELKDFKVDPAFRSRSRLQLAAHMHANPRRKSNTFALGFRYAATIAVLVIALATTGTAFAQRALPGELLYSWKLASESFWRSLQDDQFQADLTLAERRKTELGLVSGMAKQEAIGVEAYITVIQHLRADALGNPEHLDAVNQLFLDHQEALREFFAASQAGLPAIEELLGIVIPPIEETPSEPPADPPEAGEDGEGSISVPAIATAIPTVVAKKGAGDTDSNDAEAAVEEVEEEGWLEKAIDDLLGLP